MDLLCCFPGSSFKAIFLICIPLFSPLMEISENRKSYHVSQVICFSISCYISVHTTETQAMLLTYKLKCRIIRERPRFKPRNLEMMYIPTQKDESHSLGSQVKYKLNT